MVIRILDHVQRASSYEEGDVIFSLLRSKLAEGRAVELSFEGILAVPSAFVNAALVRLLEHLSYETVRAHLKIVDSTKQINDLVKSRFAFVVESAKPDHVA